MDSLPPTGSVSTISSRDFNQNSGRAKKAARNGPVVITERGQPAFVLLTIDQYEELARAEPSVAEVFSQKDDEVFEFEPPRLQGPFWRPVDFD